MWSLKYDRNGPVYNRNSLTGIETRCEVAKGEGGTGGVDSECVISRCKLFTLRMDKKQGPPYSTRTYIQTPGINCNGKEYKKEWTIYMCITESLCYTA